tara:strand:- start:1448 stop:2122 length:675 start_codon:yes stop_codon:yes gene_type:complete
MIERISSLSADFLGFLSIAVGSLSGVAIAFINLKKSKEDAPEKKERLLSDLLSHDVFNTLKRVEYEVSNIKFYTSKEYDRVKTAMCYDFTKYKVKQCGESMADLIKIDGISSMDKDKLKSLIISSQMQMHRDYIKTIREHWESKGISAKDVDYVIRLFDSFRYDVIKSFDHRITSIFSASYYDSNFDILLAVFDMWAMGIDLLPRDMQTTFENLNGKFKNLNYS